MANDRNTISGNFAGKESPPDSWLEFEDSDIGNEKFDPNLTVD
jgi:hypothetical protein